MTPKPKTKHTPTPEWYEGKTGTHQGVIIEESTGKTIAVTYDKADAPRIVKSVNCHEELLSAAENALQWLENIRNSGDAATAEKLLLDTQPPHFGLNIGKSAIRKAESYDDKKGGQ